MNTNVGRSERLNLFSSNKILFGKRFTEAQAPKVIDPTNGAAWGLTGKPNIDQVLKNASELEWKTEQINANPKKIKKKMLLPLIGVVVGIPLIIFGFGIFIIVLSLVFYAIFFGAVHGMRRDLIKYAVSKERKWLYDPSRDYMDAKNLCKYYPKIFKRDDDCYVDDQIWGEAEVNGVKRKFHSGIYCHITESTDTKGNRRRTSHFSNFFALKLEKKMSATFLLYPESVFSRVGQKFHNKEIDVESIKFNKVFAFDYDKKKAESQIDIVKILSPVVQLKLLDLNNKGSGLKVYFVNDIIIFSFKGKLLKHIKTKFKNGLYVDDRDKLIFDEYIQSFNKIAGEIVSKI